MTINLSLDLFSTYFLVSSPSIQVEITAPAGGATIDPYAGTTISGTCSDSVTSVEVFLDVVGGTSVGTASASGGTWSIPGALTNFAHAGARTLIAVANGNTGLPSPGVAITILTAKQSLALIPGLVRAFWVPLVADTDYRVDAGNAEGGTRVDRWVSITDPVNHLASQNTDPDQPALVTVSGGPMLQFDSADGTSGDKMTFSTAWLSTLANFDLFLAYKRAALGANEDILSCDGTELAVRFTSGNHFQVFMNGGTNSGRTTSVGADATNPHVALVRWNGAGGTNADKLKIEIDGVDQTLTFAGTLAQSAGHSAMAIGRQTGDTQPASCSYALIWAFNTTLSAPNRAKVYALIDHLLPWFAAP